MAINEALFASSKVISKTVKLSDGSEHELFFRELPALEFRRFALMEESKDEEKQAQSMSNIIAASLCEADGTLALTIEQANQLTAQATIAIMQAIMEVNGNGLGKLKKG